MRLALIGYGKMGHEIETIALQRGHEVVLKVTSANRHQLSDGSLQMADAAIEFTRPDAALEHVTACLNAGVPVVCGTTGWNDLLPVAIDRCNSMDGAFLPASNFSIGVNIFFEVNKKLAALMQLQPDYEVHIEEVHHIQKKDAPSGTAITIAEQILDKLTRKQNWALDTESVNSDTLPIKAIRKEGVPGTHTVTYSSPIDDLTLTHTAHNRQGFAMGAVLAAEFILGKSGIFSMKDVLGL